MRRGDLNERARKLVDERMGEGPSGAYEALQLLKSQVARAVAKKEASKGLDTAKAGCLRMLDHDNVECALPLALEYVGVLTELAQPPSDAIIASVIELADGFKAKEGGAAQDAEENVLAAALAWNGATALHGRVAAMYLRHFDESRKTDVSASLQMLNKFIANACVAEEPELLARSLIERLAGRGVEMMLAAGVMRFAARMNLRDANAALGVYARHHDHDLDGDWANAVKRLPPVLTFVAYLLKTCERDATPLFQSLTERYYGEIQVLPQGDALVAKIGELYFGVRAAPNMMDMITNMFNN